MSRTFAVLAAVCVAVLAINIDTTIIAQSPRLAPFIAAMRSNIAADLGCDAALVSVKATTTERLGFAGREEGIAAMATVLLTAMEAA